MKDKTKNTTKVPAGNAAKPAKKPAGNVVTAKDGGTKKPTSEKPATSKKPKPAKGLYRERAWEFLSGRKAAAAQPSANTDVVLHKFRWGVIKRFAITGGAAITRKEKDMALPEKPAYEWLVEHKFIQAVDAKKGIYELAAKGRQLYKLFFQNKAPRDYNRAA